MAIRQALEKLTQAGVKLKEETVVLFTGGLDVSRLKSESDSLYRKYGASGNVRHNPEEREKQFDELRQQVSRVGIRAGASFMGMKMIQDKYQYEKVPAFQTAAKVGSDFTAKMMSAMQTREQMKLEYTQMASNIIQGIAVASQAHRMMQSVRAIGPTRAMLRGTAGIRRGLRTLGVVRSAIRAARRVRNVFAGATAASGVGAIPAVLGYIATDLAFISSGFVAEKLVEAAANGRFNTAFQNTFAGSILDSNLLADFEKRRRFMPDFTFEDVQDIQSRTRQYGATEEEITSLAGYASTRIANVNQNDYAEQMYMDSRFFGVDESKITSIYSSIGNIGGGNKPVEQAKSEFQQFFAAVSNNVAPSIAEIEMVRELSSFAENYSFATKMVMDVAAVANIQGFMKRAGTGDMMTTLPTQNLAQGVDTALTGAAGATNISMMRFNARYDISMGESLQGITSDSNTLNKFLGGIVSEIGISSSGLTEDSSIRMYRLLNAMGVDADTVQIIMRIMPGFLRGERVTDVGELAAFEEQSEADETSSLLNYYKRLSDDDLRMLQINIENSDLAIEVTSKTMNAYVDRFIEIAAGFGDLSETAIRALQSKGTSSVTPSTRNRESVVNPRSSYSTAVREAYLNSEVSFGPGIDAPSVRNFIESNPNYAYVVEGARELGVRPQDLAAIIGFETGYTFSPQEDTNPHSSAHGLIQFLSGTAEDLGTTKAQMLKMTFEEQMAYVVKYLKQKGVGDKYFTIADMYLAVFQPGRLGEEIILTDPGKVEDNKVLDLNEDGTITYTELLARFGGPRNFVINLDTYELTADEVADAILETNGNR